MLVGQYFYIQSIKQAKKNCEISVKESKHFSQEDKMPQEGKDKGSIKRCNDIPKEKIKENSCTYKINISVMTQYCLIFF